MCIRDRPRLFVSVGNRRVALAELESTYDSFAARRQRMRHLSRIWTRLVFPFQVEKDGCMRKHLLCESRVLSAGIRTAAVILAVCISAGSVLASIQVDSSYYVGSRATVRRAILMA